MHVNGLLSKITVEHDPSKERLNELGISKWPIWTKEVSEFPWSYDEKETCYFLEGEVIVKPYNGSQIRMGKGDLVIFPEGMSSTWKIRKNVKKHYKFG